MLAKGRMALVTLRSLVPVIRSWIVFRCESNLGQPCSDHVSLTAKE